MTESIVCLPGFLCDHRLWTYQKELLSSYDCKYLDLRHASNINVMLDSINDSFDKPLTLVGFSMGAYLAQMFATQNPARIKQLILIGSTGAPFTDVEYKARVQVRNMLKKVSYGGINERELRHYLHPNAMNNDVIRNLIIQMAASNDTEMYLNQMNATLERPDLRMTLNAMKFPITLVGAAQDQIAPKEKVEAFHRAIPRSRLHMIEGSGHFIPLEKPEELNAILKSTIS